MRELGQHHPVAALLKAAGLARSTFYYQLRTLDAADRHADLKAQIRMVFEHHKGRYGYRRVTAAIRQAGHLVNHKTVQRLMQQLQLKSWVRPKKYRAWRGEIGTAAPNLLQRQFKATGANQKWVTDVTEFKVNGQKLYLSPVMDLYNGEIVAYQMDRRPSFELVNSMLKCFKQQRFTCVEQLRKTLERYIHYYNHERIKLKLKGLSPVQYRTQSLGA